MNQPKNKGITLVSLVVTIIILLILAGVTLALISGSDGILGRATNAVDKHKIAEIKEKVELKVAEDVEQFHEEKYVDFSIDNAMSAYEYLQEKTTKTIENGNEQYTILYTDSAEPQNPDANKIQVDYTKKNTKITVKGSISQSGVISWEDDGTVGSSGGNHNSGENGDDSGGSSQDGTEGNGNSEDLTELKSTIAQLQDEMNGLKNQLQTTNDALELSQKALETLQNETIRNIRTPLKTTATEITVSSTTNIDANTDIPINLGEVKKLKDYKFIEIQCDIRTSTGYTLEKTYLIATNQIEFNSSNTSQDNSSIFNIIVMHGGQQYPTFFNCWFKNDTTLHVQNHMAGTDSMKAIRIKAIYGIR